VTGGVIPLLAVLALPPAATAQSAGPSPDYQAALRAYASGDRERAVSELVVWTERRLREEVPELSASRPSLRKVALLLHGDCAQRARRDGLPSQHHESAALTIARMLKAESAERPFVRRWYEAMAGLALGENRWGEALDWAERGLRDFPVSAPMLLVVGSNEETVGALALLRLPEFVFSPIQRETRENLGALREARAHLERARRSLRSAVAAEPSLAEARLRLGRVAWRLGATAEARSALEEVLAREPPARTAFLAHLFLGRLDEEAGRFDDAARAYEAALALDARAQSARLALSHVRLRLGSPGAARGEVETAVAFAGLRPEPDPFWLYPWGPSVGVQARLEALRQEASS
jgi:tetratricopeptide (TPR) repeat protein